MRQNKNEMLLRLYSKLNEAINDISLEIIKGTGDINSKIALIYENKNCLKDALNIVEKLNLCPENIYMTALCKYNIKSKSNYKNILELSAPFLFEEIKIISPSICISIGSSALKAVTADKAVKLKELRGKPLEISGLIVFPVYNLKSSYYCDIEEEYIKDINKLKEIVSYII